MIKAKGYVQKLVKCINSRHQNTKFTYEEECNNKIAFQGKSITKIENVWQIYSFYSKRKHLEIYI